MGKYNVTGMSCAACSSRVEKAVSSLDGVTSCSVSLLTNSMLVEGKIDPQDVVRAVEDAGYGASLAGEGEDASASLLKDTETPKLRKRLIISVCFLIPLMIFSMGAHFNILPAFIKDKYILLASLQLVFSSVLLAVNSKFFKNGVKGVIKRAPNMDTLVALGSGISYIYSVVLFVLMCINFENKDYLHTVFHEKGLYFESAGMILVFITIGKTLEAFSKGKTTNALKNLIKLQPSQAILLTNGEEKVVPYQEIKVGDIFVVKAGAAVPVDGEIIEGEGAFDESSLTGESIPADKGVGEKIYASTVNTSGYVLAKATTVGEGTALGKIIKTVSDAVATKAPIAKIADTVSGFFVPVVILIAVIATVIWLLCGAELGYALERGISVLVISCPCALGLATPVAIMVGSGIGAKKGILFKDAAKLELLGKCDIILLDKTGTVTEGKPEVTDVIPIGRDKNELLKYAYTLEKMSEHPLAGAVNRYCEENGVVPFDLEELKTMSGAGVGAKINGERVYGASYKYTKELLGDLPELSEHFNALSTEGKTPLFFTKNDTPLGIIAVRDKIKDDSAEAISKLQQMGLYTVMLTGDNEKTAEAVGKDVGVDKIIAGVMPDIKAEIVSRMKKHGKVIMVGDGINDSPALASADIGIAIGAGTDVAIDTADIVLVKSRLSDAVTAIKLSRQTLINIKENLFWAFIYNLIGIPLASGAFIYISGGALTLTPMFGALAMSFSSVSVVLNALRLNLFNEKRAYKRAKKIIIEKEEKNMEITLLVEGMMCPHCEARVKKVLEELDGVELAIPSHKDSNVKITLSKNVDIEVLKSTIAAQGYSVK